MPAGVPSLVAGAGGGPTHLLDEVDDVHDVVSYSC